MPTTSKTTTTEIVVNWDDGTHVQAEVVDTASLRRPTRPIGILELIPLLIEQELGR